MRAPSSRKAGGTRIRSVFRSINAHAGHEKAPECTKTLAEGCLNVTNSSKNHGQFFSWPSMHLFATLGKQMHCGFPFAGRPAGVAYTAAARQGKPYSKCDVAHTDSTTLHTRCMIRTQRTTTSPKAFPASSRALHPSLLPSVQKSCRCVCVSVCLCNVSVRVRVRVFVSVCFLLCFFVDLHTDLTPLHSCTFASLVSRLVMCT